MWTHHSTAEIEPPDAWRSLGDDGIWRKVLGQVALIGRSNPWDQILSRWQGSGLEYDAVLRVLAVEGTDTVASLIQLHFVQAGVRYAGVGEAPSLKANACVRNLVRLRALGGPERFAEIVSRVDIENERVELVRDLLRMVASKGARDLLMGLGLHRNGIALDARVMKVLRAAGVTLLEKAPSDRKAYAALEQRVIDEVALPLGVEPIVVDRTLYQRTADMIAALGRGRVDRQAPSSST